MFGVFMTGLCKIFYCLHHKLTIAKLNVYDLDLWLKRLIENYLTNGKQRVKIDKSYKP